MLSNLVQTEKSVISSAMELTCRSSHAGTEAVKGWSAPLPGAATFAQPKEVVC